MAFPGWNETLEYADDPNNVAIYDVNTIANTTATSSPYSTNPHP
jgi:hypothetical protein